MFVDHMDEKEKLERLAAKARKELASDDPQAIAEWCEKDAKKREEAGGSSAAPAAVIKGKVIALLARLPSTVQFAKLRGSTTPSYHWPARGLGGGGKKYRKSRKPSKKKRKSTKRRRRKSTRRRRRKSTKRRR
jgi:hypothetical protein